ncbi:MAG: hypothetical protein [Caudoviricetes sp.]|nr:MAG: hypothetical protein [Caudoviricetes sp.]
MHSAGCRGRSPQGSSPWLCPQAERFGVYTKNPQYGPSARRSSNRIITGWTRFDSWMVYQKGGTHETDNRDFLLLFVSFNGFSPICYLGQDGAETGSAPKRS